MSISPNKDRTTTPPKHKQWYDEMQSNLTTSFSNAMAAYMEKQNINRTVSEVTINGKPQNYTEVIRPMRTKRLFAFMFLLFQLAALTWFNFIVIVAWSDYDPVFSDSFFIKTLQLSGYAVWTFYFVLSVPIWFFSCVAVVGMYLKKYTNFFNLIHEKE